MSMNDTPPNTMAQDFYRAHKHRSAINVLEQSLRKQPLHYDDYLLLSSLYHLEKQDEKSIWILEKAIELKPKNAAAYSNLAGMHIQKGDLETAIVLLEKAIKRDPTFSSAYSNLGLIYFKKNEAEKAIEYLEKAVQLNPRNSEAYCNLALTYKSLDNFEKTFFYLEKALSINTNNGQFHYCLATALVEQNKLTEAVHHFHLAIHAEPESADYHWNLALTLLTLGQFAEGWREYTWRWKLSYLSDIPQYLRKPLWNGQTLNDETLYIYAEQGLGDTLHFCRYIPLIPRTRGKIIFHCQPSMVPLMQSLQGVDELGTLNDPHPENYTWQAPLMSLPEMMKTFQREDIPHETPYLSIDPEKTTFWKTRMQTINTTHKKIGIVWAGNPDHARDKSRSCKLKQFSPLFELNNISWFNLQKDHTENLSQYPEIIDWTDDIKDFSDTAALLSQLDLLISVDTSVVHLAGSLGLPAWVLIAYSPDWRWLLDCEDSIWYPSLQLFRQKTPGDWDEVFLRIKTNLP